MTGHEVVVAPDLESEVVRIAAQAAVEVLELGVLRELGAEPRQLPDELTPGLEPVAVDLEPLGRGLHLVVARRTTVVLLGDAGELARAHRLEFGQRHVAAARQPAVAVGDGGAIEVQRLADLVEAAGAVARLAHRIAELPPEALEALLEIVDPLAPELHGEFVRAVAREVEDGSAPGIRVGLDVGERVAVGRREPIAARVDRVAPLLDLGAPGVQRPQRLEIAIEILQVAADQGDVGPEVGPLLEPPPGRGGGAPDGADPQREGDHRALHDAHRSPAHDQLDPQGQREDGAEVGEPAGGSGELGPHRLAPAAAEVGADQQQAEPRARAADEVAGQHPGPGPGVAPEQEDDAEHQQGPRQRPGHPSQAPDQRPADGVAELARGQAGQQEAAQHHAAREQHQAQGLEIETRGPVFVRARRGLPSLRRALGGAALLCHDPKHIAPCTRETWGPRVG